MIGLILKEKVDIDGEKCARISTVAKKTNTSMTPHNDYGIQTTSMYLYFLFSGNVHFASLI